MNSNTLIKCAKCCARKPSARKRLGKRASFSKQAALAKYATAIKSVYMFKVASMDLLEQASKDPDLAATLQRQFN